MVCYVLPTAAALVTWRLRKRAPSDERLYWLNLLFIGAAVFGVVDHLWNGQLFLVGPNILGDLALGVAITLVVLLVWAGMVAAAGSEAFEKIPASYKK